MSVGFDWDNNSPDSVAKDIDSMKRKLLSNLRQAMEDIVAKIREDAKDLAPHDTGKLENSIKSAVLPVVDDMVTGVVGSNLDYAKIVSEGRGRITVEEGYMHFYDNGEEVFTKSVGPVEPQPFLEPAVTRNEEYIHQRISKALEEL